MGAVSEPRPLSDYAARAFLRYLERRYPGVKWVRVREDEGRRDVTPVALPRDVDLRVGSPTI